MAYTTFSTDNADYVLQLGNHKFRNKQVDIFEGIDALVIENSNCTLQNLFEKKFPQYSLAFEFCAENNVPVFGADVVYHPTDNDFSSLAKKHWLLLPLLLYYGLISKSEISDLHSNLITELDFEIQQPLTTGRNAINARKIEEFVVPTVNEKIKKRPYLGLMYGFFHLGIKKDLEDKARRDSTIANLQKNFKKNHLNRIQEANYKRREWKFQSHTVNLFE
ncbi:MAG TPA: hypothetical protein VJB13_00280 [Candidatus Nanoarchaeia archaeon]|nr:hypothetical protein [Candidatus Nanoarchaeia archaeon]